VLILGAVKSMNSASEAREMPLQIAMRNCADVRLGFSWWQTFIGQAWCTENEQEPKGQETSSTTEVYTPSCLPSAVR